MSKPKKKSKDSKKKLLKKKYRVTWFNKETGRVTSEGVYRVDASLQEIVKHFKGDLIEGSDCCVMIDPDNFPHSSMHE